MFLSLDETKKAFPNLFLYEQDGTRLKYTKIESLAQVFKNLEGDRDKSIATFLDKASDDSVKKTILIYTWNCSTDVFELESYRDNHISVSKLDDPISFEISIPLSETTKTITVKLFTNGQSLIYDVIDDELIIHIIRY